MTGDGRRRRRIRVREATPADAADWVALRHALWPHATLRDLRATARAFFGAGTLEVAAVFLAFAADAARDHGEAPCGFLELSLRAHVPGVTEVPAPFVEGWFVERRVRRRGVGRALMAAAERWSRARGHRALGSDTQLDNRRSRVAHRALGFGEHERLVSFVKRLGGPRPTRSKRLRPPSWRGPSR